MIHILKEIGMIAAIVTPLWNIPLIVKLIKTKSSKEFSLLWVFGMWACLTLMTPSGLLSTDTTFLVLSILNFTMFSAVLFCVVLYRNGHPKQASG
jgi:uncharacterized protein with PQ loop repeat